MNMRSPQWFGTALVGLFACGGPEAIPGTQLSFEPNGSFWEMPFPGSHRRTSEGNISLSGFPNPQNIDFVLDLRRIVERDARGFGTTSTLYFRSDAPIEISSLPSLQGSLRPEASAYLVNVDAGSPRFGRRVPLRVAFLPDPGPFGAPNLLGLQPLQGTPLAEGTLYAAVVTRAVRDSAGARLGVPETTRRLIEDEEVEGLSQTARRTFDRGLIGLERLGVDLDDIAGLTVFRTGRPSEELPRFLQAALREGPPLPLSEFRPREVFEDFCVFEARARFPVYQRGESPYLEAGGGWDLEAANPSVERFEESRMVATVPRRPMPSEGFPTVVFIRTGGGGDRPLVDRGVRDQPGGSAVAPGTGPAREFARVGFSALSWDGPLGGIRNPNRGDEQFLVFNFGNPEALRDNIRQSALETALLAHTLESLALTATACPGLTDATVRFDTAKLALMGHSMGGTIAPLAAAIEPRFRAVVLSGAGGSWIENVIHKLSPVAVRPLAEILLDYDDQNRTLEPFDPALALLQWAGEPADPPVYAQELARPSTGETRHILMLQGVVDTYILPEIANALSLATSLDLAGTALESSLPELLPFAGADAVELPVRGNAMDQRATQVVTQHREGPIEDGHEVVFQTEPPKGQYRCFLSSFGNGEVPVVVSAEGQPSCP